MQTKSAGDSRARDVCRRWSKSMPPIVAAMHEDPPEDDDERGGLPELHGDREPEEDAGQRRTPGIDRARLHESQQPEQHECVLRPVQVGCPLDVRRRAPGGVESACSQTGEPVVAAGDECDEDGVHGPEHHDRDPRDCERHRVAREVSEHRER